MKYPITKFPVEILQALQSEIIVEGMPIKPEIPLKKEIIIIQFVIIGVPITFFEFALSVGPQIILTTIGVIFFIIICSAIHQDISNTANYVHNKKNYEIEYSSYINKLNDYNIITRNIRTVDATRAYRQGLIKNLLKNSKIPIRSQNRTSAGITEEFFFSFLNMYFEGKISRGYIFNEKKVANHYQPDFILYDKQYNLYVDIEIDEPYVWNSSEPIHYLDDEGQHIDLKRDTFFNNQGWIVIRFSEEQVVNFPESCCRAIGNIIYQLIGDIEYLSISSDSLPTIKCWTIQEARQFIAEKLRTEYLINASSNFILNSNNILENHKKPDKITKEDAIRIINTRTYIGDEEGYYRLTAISIKNIGSKTLVTLNGMNKIHVEKAKKCLKAREYNMAIKQLVTIWIEYGEWVPIENQEVRAYAEKKTKTVDSAMIVTSIIPPTTATTKPNRV